MTVEQLVLAVTIGMASNADNMGIGLFDGPKTVRIPTAFFVVIPVLSGAACFMGAVTGYRITNSISPEVCSIIGAFMMCCIGLWVLVQALLNRNDHTFANLRSNVGFHEMMLVGLAQAVSDLSIGFGAGFTRMSAVYTSISVCVFSVMMLLIPLCIGGLFRRPGFQIASTSVAGMLLFIAGISQL